MSMHRSASAKRGSAHRLREALAVAWLERLDFHPHDFDSIAGAREERIFWKRASEKKIKKLARHSDLPRGVRRSIDRRASLEGALDEGEAAGPVVTEIGQG